MANFSVLTYYMYIIMYYYNHVSIDALTFKEYKSNKCSGVEV